MNKINFQNGTLVSKAKVTVNGTVYEVEPAEYEGTTPLSAEVLNQMQDNIETDINEKKQDTDNKLTKLKGTVLYESTTGSKNDITLNESAENYESLEIEYKYQNTYNTAKVFNPSGKLVSLSISTSVSQYNAARVQYKTVAINGTSITNNQYGYLTISEASTMEANTHENDIFITKVIGYKS